MVSYSNYRSPMLVRSWIPSSMPPIIRSLVQSVAASKLKIPPFLTFVSSPLCYIINFLQNLHVINIKEFSLYQLNTEIIMLHPFQMMNDFVRNIVLVSLYICSLDLFVICLLDRNNVNSTHTICSSGYNLFNQLSLD